MAEPPVFFLPYLTPDLQEDAYEFMADRVKRPVPCMGKRVYSITFDVKGTTWTATVGQPLNGRKIAPLQLPNTWLKMLRAYWRSFQAIRTAW